MIQSLEVDNVGKTNENGLDLCEHHEIVWMNLIVESFMFVKWESACLYGDHDNDGDSFFSSLSLCLSGMLRSRVKV